MILCDFECDRCGVITEHYVKSDCTLRGCPECGGPARKIISLSQTGSYDAPWLREVLEVVDKSGKKPHCNEFLKHPTRANYKAWMKGEGLRHRDPAEPFAPKVDRKARRAEIKRNVLNAMRKREAIEI